MRDGDDYVVNGQKTWTTLAQYADWIFCLARTDPNAPKKQAGISFLLFDMKTPGVTVRPIKLIDGGYEVNEVFFEDVRVPAENLVGEENQGWSYAKFLLGNERTGVTRRRHAPRCGSAQAKERAAADHDRRAARCSTIRCSPPGSPNWRTNCSRWSSPSCGWWPVRPTASRIPASSVLKLRGSELQQAATELLIDVAGPDSLPFAAGDGSPRRSGRSGRLRPT